MVKNIPVPILFKPDCTQTQTFDAIKRLEGKFDVRKGLTKSVILSQHILHKLYGNLYVKKDKTLWRETVRRLEWKRVVVLVVFVEGEDGLSKLVEYIGEGTNPSECAEESLRYMYGKWKEQIGDTELYWYLNAIHRPKTLEEAEVHLCALFPDMCLETT